MHPLLDRYLAFLTDGSTPDGVFAADVILDMNVPAWRFQVQGVAALRESRLVAGGVWDVHQGPVTLTADGFVVETSYDSVEAGVPMYTRSVNLVTVHDGRIARVVHYCTGPWDPATRDRQAREAPMLATPLGAASPARVLVGGVTSVLGGSQRGPEVGHDLGQESGHVHL